MNELSRIRTIATLAVATTVLGITTPQAQEQELPDHISFNRDIRPILSEHCYACHGPDEGQRKAGLRLDIEEEALRELKSGNHAIVRSNSTESQLIQRIQSDDPDEIMPPPEHGKPLSDRQKSLLETWIRNGAKWEGHWAYITPERPMPPTIKNPDWVKNPIDQFIRAKHESLGLPTSDEAPKTKLIRRASLDLTGLPPTVEEIDAFLEDDSDQAYDQLVDRLLDSKHYGERQAMFWLDLARYGETQGFHHDRHRDMWHWRDWVINAYNDNKPFDEFTIEQLAGDLLPNPTNDQLIATGFHRNEMTTSEGGALPEEYSVKYVVGRVDTTARVWLGTSLACAECHDHKYDPISQKDYYRFFAYFNNVPEDGLDRGMNPRPRLSLATKEQERKLQELNKEYDALNSAHKNVVTPAHEEHDRKQNDWALKLESEGLKNWTLLAPLHARSQKHSDLTWDDKQVLTASGTLPNKDVYTIDFHTSLTNITALRLEAIPDSNADHGKSGRSETGDFILTRFEVSSRAEHEGSDNAKLVQPSFGDWRHIGPFAVAASDTPAVEAPMGPESNLDFSASYKPNDRRWSDAADNLSQLLAAASKQPGIHYLASDIQAPADLTASLTLDTKSSLRLWANWKLIGPNSSSENESKHQFELPLEQGLNRLLIKLHVADTPLELRAHVSNPAAERAIVKLKTAAASVERSRYGIRGTLDEKIETGWSVWGQDEAGKHTEYAWFQTEKPFGHPEGTAIRVKLSFNSPVKKRLLGRFRLAISTSTGLDEFLTLPQNIRTEIVKVADARSDSHSQALQIYYRDRFVEEAKQLKKLLETKRRERDSYNNGLPVAMVMGEREKTKETFMLVRGEYNNPGEKVSAGIPSALFPKKPQANKSRLDLAQWLVDPDHPLTSRVIVNHYWQQFFGTGIVKTAEDFGSQGEWPSHPDLLDWLAREFVESGWDIKHIHKLIVTSATYRQASTVLPQHLKNDSGNRYLARFPRVRLEAEAIRDVAMAASGLLDRTIGGQSTYPYQPPGLWEQVAFQGTRKWEQSQGDKNYRRGLYVYWRRSVPYASFVTFDAPSRETCTVKRPRTNTPLQALVLMNDPVYVEAARSFGLRIMREGGEKIDERIEFAFRTVLSRPPTEAELSEMRQAFLVELSHFESDRAAANQLVHVGASDPPIDTDICELAAWTILGNILLNLDETITKG